MVDARLSHSSAVKQPSSQEEEEVEAMLEGELQMRKVKFDEILEELGDFGKYQKLAYFLLFLPTIFSAMQKQSWWVSESLELNLWDQKSSQSCENSTFYNFARLRKAVPWKTSWYSKWSLDQWIEGIVSFQKRYRSVEHLVFPSNRKILNISIQWCASLIYTLWS